MIIWINVTYSLSCFQHKGSCDRISRNGCEQYGEVILISDKRSTSETPDTFLCRNTRDWRLARRRRLSKILSAHSQIQNFPLQFWISLMCKSFEKDLRLIFTEISWNVYHIQCVLSIFNLAFSSLAHYILHIALYYCLFEN